MFFKMGRIRKQEPRKKIHWPDDGFPQCEPQCSRSVGRRATPKRKQAVPVVQGLLGDILRALPSGSRGQ